MEARISAVATSLWLVFGAALLCAVVTLPAPENRAALRVQRELQAFDVSFRREEAEAKLLAQARAQGSQSLRSLRLPERSKRVQSVAVADDALPVQPLAAVSLHSLAAVADFGASHPAVELAVPDLSGVGGALAWRLARSAPNAKAELLSARAMAADVSAEDMVAERTLPGLQQAAEQATKAAAEAERRLAQAETTLENRTKKRRPPRKQLDKLREARAEARALFTEKSAAAKAAQAACDSAAEARLKARHLRDVPPLPEFGVLQVVLTLDGAASEFDVPVAFRKRSVGVTPLPAASFSALRTEGLWDSVKGGDVLAAQATVSQGLHWHLRRAQVLGWSVQAALLLQFLPLLMPLSLLFVLRRIDALAVSYSPFTTEVRGALPRPGLRSRLIEALAVLVLPIVACASAATALLMISATPIIPVLSAALSFVLGLRAFGKLDDLRAMVESVVQSHSYPPLP
jgi:hypothetical protein